MPVTFEVDEVEPAASPAETIGLRDLVGDHAFLGIDPDLRVLDDRTTHPLIGGVHRAFVDHRPLVLSPDAVWLTIAQGVAQHVRIHAEAPRSRLVTHSGKQVLEIALASKPASAGEWAGAITAFRHALASVLGEGRARLLTCDFSTTSDAERIASEVVLMDVMSPYYDYSVSVICGIPRITLLGTHDDWERIRSRIDVIRELDLNTWSRSLERIADQFVAAANGQPDTAFFQNIYKPRKAYGWDRVTGWIARLYPYVQSGRGDFSAPNPLLALPIDHVEPETEGYFNGTGVRTSDPPPGASRVLVRVRNSNSDAPPEIVTIEGGLLAVEQNERGELVPRAGYLVRVNHGVDQLIERLLAEHDAVAGNSNDGAKWHHDAQLRAFFEAVASATIRFSDGAVWTLLPPAERSCILIARDLTRALVATRVMDVGDGTALAITENGHVIRMSALRIAPAPTERPPDVADDEIRLLSTADRCDAVSDERAETIPVVSSSLVEFLMRALSSGVDLRSTASLLDVEPEWWDTIYHAKPLLDRLRGEGKVVDAPKGLAFLGVAELVVGTATWRKFEAPPEWNGGNPVRHIQVATEQLWVEPIFDLGDRTLLARVVSYPHRCIIRLEIDAIEAKPLKKKRVQIESSQPLGSIPVLGRNLVDVVSFAVEHGSLPRPVEALSDFASRGRQT